MGRRNEEELRIQKAFIEWCWNNWKRWPDVAIKIPRRIRISRKTIEIMAESVPFFHPANGELRDSSTGAKLNAQGLRKGMLDLVLPVPSGGHPGMIIEVKKPKGVNSKRGVVSKYQKIWLNFFEAMGWRIEVCYSLAECIDVTIDYLDSRSRATVQL